MIYDGIADKCGMTVCNLAPFVAGFVVSFVHAWKLALVMLPMTPLLAFSEAFMAIAIRKSSTKSLTAYYRAGAIAEQAIASIRTVVSYGGQNRELRKYSKHLDGIYATGFLDMGEISPGQIISFFFGMLIGSYALGRIGPNFGSFAAAQSAAHNIYRTVDRIPNIDASPTDKEIEDVCKLANAHEFILKLSERYNALVGERGALLSGGQKQRVAIAHALIRNPRILLLDEATSALGSEPEKLVQEALDKARNGCTTIDADLILVAKDGTIVKSGRHSELTALGGVYSELCRKQNLEKIRARRGLRHYWGVRGRGQHTATTGRRGRAVGVSKKK